MFDVTIPGTILPDEHVSATATSSLGDTSEFSATPPLTPGTLADVSVTTAAGTSTLEGGFAVDFLDVPGSHPFYTFVTNIFLHRITAGVGGGNYGVDFPVLRRQMAVFLMKVLNGPCYAPPPATGKVFGDVPANSPAADWIEAFSATGITSGCGGGNYCPEAPVRRDQMAVFLLKAEHGVDYTPPDCVGTFNDVLCTSPFARWVERLYVENVTGGCNTNPLLYCPDASVTRGQMAVFVTRVFF